MRDKYIEERFPRYFIFGEKGDIVDVSDPYRDIAYSLTREQANTLIAERDKVIDMLVKVTQALDKVAEETLYDIWYVQ